MSLFLQSMVWKGWRYAEENAEFFRFESGEGDRLVTEVLSGNRPVS